jgi:hypothetical protein
MAETLDLEVPGGPQVSVTHEKLACQQPAGGYVRSCTSFRAGDVTQNGYMLQVVWMELVDDVRGETPFSMFLMVHQ